MVPLKIRLYASAKSSAKQAEKMRKHGFTGHKSGTVSQINPSTVERRHKKQDRRQLDVSYPRQDRRQYPWQDRRESSLVGA